MTLEESREIIPLMEYMIGQIEEQQTLMAEMLPVSYTHLDVYKRQECLLRHEQVWLKAPPTERARQA